MKIINILLLIISISTNNLLGEIADFSALQKKYHEFNINICKFPTSNNTITAIAGQNQDKQKKIIEYAKNSYVVIDDKTIELCNAFITFKKNNGSNIEKSLYKNMSLSDFIIRLLEKRPLVFMNKSDDSKLRTPNAHLVPMDFTKIGTTQQKKPLLLDDYLSYDEIKIAALIGVSSPTYFINNGTRNNAGKIDPKGTFQEEGIYVGLVGARFEKENFMEWQDIIITKEQNTDTNGYGLAQCNQGLLKLWSDFYGCKFPTYEQAAADTTGQYSKHGQNFFNKTVYKKRIELVIRPFLYDANKRGQEQNKKVYVHATGLGLGVWAVLPQEQTKCIIEVYKNIINTNDLPYIANIDFSWFGDSAGSLVPNMKNGSICPDQKNNPITIHFSTRNPADALTGINANKLLVASYAWDGNAYPGNEYWAGMLTATGDPAAACCSLIATMQNILINPQLQKNIINTYGPTTMTADVKKISIMTRLKSFVNSAFAKIGYKNFFNLEQ